MKRIILGDNAEVLPTLPESERLVVESMLACRWDAAELNDPPTAWNLGRARARTAMLRSNNAEFGMRTGIIGSASGGFR